MLPWMMQSPLFPHIAVFMSSVTQALELGQQPNEALEPLRLKSNVLTMINKALRAGHDLSDLLRSAENLIIIEVRYLNRAGSTLNDKPFSGFGEMTTACGHT
jgi:hypothetical protein